MVIFTKNHSTYSLLIPNLPVLYHQDMPRCVTCLPITNLIPRQPLLGYFLNGLSMIQEQVKTRLYEQLPSEELIQQTVARGEGKLAAFGALCVTTGKFTGRSPQDKYIVNDTIAENKINWNKFNQPIAEDIFLQLRQRIENYLDSRPEVWARNMYACADRQFRLSIRIFTETPWANLFAANLFIEPEAADLAHFTPEWTVLQAPGFVADPVKDGTRSANFTIISFQHRTILIGGSAYTGEIKKGIFSVLNFLLPQRNVFTMHCSANEDTNGNGALFFGLSGTGKTTLSADTNRRLIGDDEHGWSDKGVFNFEGGCYAKIIDLSAEHEPDIFGAIRHGALVENTLPDAKGMINFADCSITENTRASYPLDFIANGKIPSTGGHPRHLFFLSCDAYGVLPPLSRLDLQQAIYYFINGYTAKVAGTEVGIAEPKVTFSTCFGAPFLPLAPETYAHMLAEKVSTHNLNVWLVNTGWTGGPYGTGERISLRYTRAMINAVLDNSLQEDYCQHPVFNLAMPTSCPGVPAKLLDPRRTWQSSVAYDEAAKHLARLFDDNYRQIMEKK